MFDFDELEDVMPSESMPDDEFRGFGGQLDAALADSSSYSDLVLLITRATWDEEKLPTRLPKIVDAILGRVDAEARAPWPDAERGSALMYMLWQLSLSTSLHEVRVRRSNGRCCALILGFGGSGVEDLELQAAHYEGLGFTVIYASPAMWPQDLVQKQEDKIAAELRAALAEDGSQFVLHCCSHAGVCKGISLIDAWVGGKGPFVNMPPLAERFKAMVFECAPARPLDPGTGEVLGAPRGKGDAPRPAAAAESGAAADDETTKKVVESEVKFLYMVVVGCVGALVKKNMPNKPPFVVALHESSRMQEFVKDAARHSVLGAPAWSLSGMATKRADSLWDFPDFEAWDMALARPPPRLFLYSEKDAVVAKDKVEAYVRYVRRHHPSAKVFTASTPKSPHCKLWSDSAATCREAVAKLLSEAGVASVPQQK